MIYRYIEIFEKIFDSKSTIDAEYVLEHFDTTHWFPLCCSLSTVRCCNVMSEVMLCYAIQHKFNTFQISDTPISMCYATFSLRQKNVAEWKKWEFDNCSKCPTNYQDVHCMLCMRVWNAERFFPWLLDIGNFSSF